MPSRAAKKRRRKKKRSQRRSRRQLRGTARTLGWVHLGFKTSSKEKTPRDRLGLAGFCVFSPSLGYFFFGGTIASFAALATRNLTTFLAGILMASPVAGLRPIRALRSTRTSLPSPGTTKTPLFLTSLIASSATVSSKSRATLLLTSQVSAS